MNTNSPRKDKPKHHTFLNLTRKALDLILLLSASAFIAFIWQRKIAIPYLTSGRAVGGDYFNALTYANFFAKHLPFPPTGWMPFWNGGIPIIGGYPTLLFYLMLPLTRIFDPATSMELTSIVLILLFLIASYFLFWEASRNHLLSLIFTGILIVTPATYYSLTAEGLFTASAMQWLLPTSFFFLIRFTKFQRPHMLVAGSILTGIAFITHSAMALLTIFIPALLFLLTSSFGDPENTSQTQQLQLLKQTTLTKIKIKTTYLLVFGLLTTLIGSIGLYTLIQNMFFSAGSGACESLQCWGDYPEHLNLWFSSLIIPPLIIFLPFTIIAKLIKKLRHSEVFAPLAAITPLIIYAAAAKLQLINNLTSAIFPRRLFWAITLFILLIASVSFRYISKSSKKLALIGLSIFVVTFTVFTFPQAHYLTAFSLSNYLKIPNSIPMRVDQYIVPKYQNLTQTDLIPTWVSSVGNNWRLDSVRPDFFVWWNAATQIPATRGYSNAPTKEHTDWLYYLQTSTIASEKNSSFPNTTFTNRALFLLDAFAIRFLQYPSLSLTNPDEGYASPLLNHPNLITRSQQVREWNYIELNADFISPIITPTNASRILVVSDQFGFETFNRAISLENLNSRLLIPIKGPQSINKLSEEILKNIDVLVLYQFTGNKWDNIESYLETGGKLFIDTGSLKNPPFQLSEIIGVSNLEKNKEITSWNLKRNNSSNLLNNINTQKFSPPIFENKPWTIIAPSNTTHISSWMQPILTQNDIPILTIGETDNAKVIFSGFNLPYHITSYQNPEEARLLKNILLELIPETKPIGDYSIHRPQPNSVTISTTNSRGIYFKENFHSGWKAIVNGQPTPVYEAGLNFMYIPIPQGDLSDTTHISLNFKGNLTTWLIPIISLVTLFFSLLYILFSTPFRIFNNLFIKSLTSRLRAWWKRD